MKSVFGSGPLSPSPREDMHYMAKFMNTMQVNLNSSPNGTLSVVVNPQSMFSPEDATSGIGFYPYVIVNSVNPLTPFVNNQSVKGGPFSSQDSLTSLKAPDVCNLRFINTMNSLVSSGKLTVSVFYEPLDNNWFLPLNYSASFT